MVHNTAANSVRDGAHDGELLADPAQQLRAGELDIDSRLNIREALAEVAALPTLQREVIVRTAMAGDSHEQVASDLGITNGAVRGLLYRARATLRGAVTALTPPQLLGWLAGRADQGGPAPERLTELAGGGGTVGLGGLLLKGGVAAITAGTVVTSAAVVHIAGSAHHRAPHRLIATAAPTHTAAASIAAAGAHLGASQGNDGSAGSRLRHFAGGGRGRGASDANTRARGGFRVTVGTPGGRRAPRSTTPLRGTTGDGAPRPGRDVPSANPPSTPGTGSNQGGGPGENGGSSQGGSSGQGGQVSPVGSTSSNGSTGATGTSGSTGATGASGSSGQGSEAGGTGTTGGSETGTGSGSGSPEGSGSQGSPSESQPSSGSESSSGSGGENSGGLIGTVVHEVGNVLEHLLH